MTYKFKTILFIAIMLISSLCSINAIAQQNKINPNGYNRFYNKNGNLQSEGEMRNGKPDGYWKSYYENNIIQSEGNRVNFLLEGNWKFYNENGVLKMEVQYEGDKKEGKRKMYNKYGYLSSEETYKQDIIHGEVIHYYEDSTKQGIIKSVTNYSEGFKNGKEKEFNSEGTIITIREFDNGFVKKEEILNRRDKFGFKQAIWREYYNNGMIKSEGRYKDDQRNGIFREYSEDGKLKNTVKYENDIIVEAAEELTNIKVERDYFPDARIKSEITLVNGVPNGVYREYSQNGEIVASKIYRGGIVAGEGIIDKSGKKTGGWKDIYPAGELKSEGKYENGNKTGNWTYFYENSEIEQQGAYIDGKCDGLWKWYYETGNIRRMEEFKKGIENGVFKEYNDSGALIAKGNYISGEKDGPWYYKTGDYREEGQYIADKKYGLWKHYHHNDKLSFHGEFIDGNPNGKHQYYYETGKIKEEGVYIMGNKEGVWKKYDKEGNITLTTSFENGIEKRYEGVKLKPETEIE